MKTNKKSWLWLAVAIIVGGTGCDLSLQPTEKGKQGGGSTPKPSVQKTVQKPQQSQPKTVAQPKPQPQPQPQQQRRTVADDVNSVVNYGIGATQLKAKQNMQNKIQNIQQRKNKEMEDALK